MRAAAEYITGGLIAVCLVAAAAAGVVLGLCAAGVVTL
jgi:hypothetical protein